MSLPLPEAWTLALLVLAPVIGFALIALFGRTALMQRFADRIATAMVGISLLVALSIFSQSLAAHDATWTWGTYSFQGWASSAAVAPGFGATALVPGAERFVFRLGTMVDNLGAMMLVVVTLVSFLVHLYSQGYMHGEVRYVRFFCILQLFTAAMLGLVVSDNLLTLYVCWELMGYSSYALIGHYYEKKSAQNACMKAFMTTRIGDVLMFVGLMIIWANVGSLSYDDIYTAVAHGYFDGEPLFWAGILVFMGAVGKSAQFPLHVWLPDAMEGPTPVSALIHAATMVAAGVYLTARMVPAMTPEALLFVAYVGGFTALFAATIAVAQDDIKKVLAYSTISQLGYMMLGLGLAKVTVDGYSYGVYHLTTHAFFKACLFLGSGSIIHAMHHEQRMSRYGGLWKVMPVTFATFLVATLCLTGLYATSGFYSKDGVIAAAIEYGFMKDGAHFLLPVFAIVGALFTAFYMFRLIFLTFTGEPRDHHAFEHAHESGWKMATPLVVLAVVSLAAGLGGGKWFKEMNPMPSVAAYESRNPNYVGTYMVADAGPAAGAATTALPSVDRHAQLAAMVRANVVAYATAAPETHAAGATGAHGDGGHGADDHDAHVAHAAHTVATVMSFFLFGGGIVLASLFYWDRFRRFDPAIGTTGAAVPVHNLLLNKYYIDEIYQRYLVVPTLAACRALFGFDARIVDGVVNATGKATLRVTDVAGEVDRRYVDGLVNRLAASTYAWGGVFSRLQTGNLRTYLMSIVLGVILLITFFVIFPSELAQVARNVHGWILGLVGVAATLVSFVADVFAAVAGVLFTLLRGIWSVCEGIASIFWAVMGTIAGIFG